MGFFDNLKGKAADLAQAGVAQSKRLAEIAKLKTANLGEEDNIKKAYIEIGKLYYAEKSHAPEGAYAAACEKITAAKAAIEANNDRIAELKAAGDDADVEIVEVIDESEVTAADFVDEAKEAAEEVVEEIKEAVEDVAEEIKD